jgi:cephalosporin hydroxylase/glycosyltransferase involved in cell wall biosynthesis
VYPFWDLVIAPVIEAAGAKRIVEIGALRGDTTVRMLDRLGPDTELHVIDPVPEFDPEEHMARFPGRYVFYRDISHNVLPRLGPVDVALVDGDHNWYTVYHELKMLAEAAEAAGQPLPVLIMHDVLWPYGRRDLYYTPETIPDEFRHPYAQRGMRPGRSELVPEGGGGVSPTLNNALEEGGPRNGVMTALEDFLAEYSQPVRLIVIPIYFGLAIVASEERLARAPELSASLDALESADQRGALLELSEQLRLEAVNSQHNFFYGTLAKIDRGAERYLDLLEGALLNEHYLENEVRLWYLLNCVELGRTPDLVRLQDPARYMRSEAENLARSRKTGTVQSEGNRTVFFPYAAMGRTRLDHLRRCLEVVRTAPIAGDLVECGTLRGGGAILMRGYLEAFEMRKPSVWIADRFHTTTTAQLGGQGSPTGGPEPASNVPEAPVEAMGDLNVVRDGFARFGLLDDRVRFLHGDYSETLPDAPIEQIALLRVSTTTYEDTWAVLTHLYPKLVDGGFVIVESYANGDSSRAVDEFRSSIGASTSLERVDWAAAFWRKSAADGLVDVDRAQTILKHPPLAPPVPTGNKDLTVVLCVYNMRREAERTLWSLTRAYQNGIEDLDYEVIVVENGSDDQRKLHEDFVTRFGPEFSYIDMAEDASPSPVPALNRGIEAGSGENYAIMIDAAHVLTPGVLRFGMLGLRVYGPAVVATQQWYVGPGQQNETMLHGYDKAYEDRLFESIEWPSDGYRLFDIGHFIGERDWFDGLWESNCLFVPRKTLEQIGGLDAAFTMPGGEYANLDFYERVTSAPDVVLVSMLGEGSFHQIHGGTTTNESVVEARTSQLDAYRQRYADLRGRFLRGPGKPIHYVGSFSDASKRTRARRMSASEYFRTAQALMADQRPPEPVPIPDELKVEFTDAFWRSDMRQEVTWLARRVSKCPTDLLVYQELVARVKPDWVIETGTGGGGRAFFLATICELMEHGQVVSITDGTAAPMDKLPQHQRITYLDGDATSGDTIERLHSLVGEDANALVIFGLTGCNRLLKMWEHYEPLIPVGSYAVLEETITNGNPVWPGMGPGPREASKEILKLSPNFIADNAMEKFGLTFNPGGYLKRTS